MEKKSFIQRRLFRILILLIGCYAPTLSYSFNSPATSYQAGAIDTTGQVICQEETGVLIRTIRSTTDASGSNYIRYKWQVSDSGQEFQDISGNHNSPDFLPTRFNSFGHYYIFKRLVQFESNGTWHESAGTYKLIIDLSNQTVTLSEIQASASDICKEELVTLSVRGTTNSLDRIRYTWSNGSSEATITVRPSTTTTYSVTASVSSGNCAASATESIIIHVYPEFHPGIISSAQDTVCLNSPVSPIEDIRSATGGHGVKTYRWKVNGILIDGANEPTYTPETFIISTPGTYTFSREATDGKCSDWTSSENEYTLVVSNLSATSIPILTQDTIICNRQSALLTASIESPSPTQWQWFAGSGSFIQEIEGATSAQYQTPAMTESSSFTVIATTTLSDGNFHCTASGSQTVHVTVLKPNVSIDNIEIPTHICYGNPITLSAHTQGNESGNLTFQWYVGENSVPIPDANSTDFQTEALTGDLFLTVVATNTVTELETTCSTTDTQKVHITVPEPLKLTLTVQNESCDGSDGRIIVEATGGTHFQLGDADYYLYTWYQKNESGDSLLIGSNISEMRYLQAGNYSISVTDANGCTSWSETSLYLDNPLNIQQEILAEPIICNGGSFSIIPQNEIDGDIPSGTLYSWKAPVVEGVTGTNAGINQSSIHDENLFYSGTASSVDIPYLITASYGNICSNSTTLIVKVNVSVYGNTHITTTDDTVCPGIGLLALTVELSAANRDYDLTWTFNGSTSTQHCEAGNTHPTFMVEIPSDECHITYPYNVAIQDSLHCQNSQSGSITVRIPHWQASLDNIIDTVSCPLEAISPIPPTVTDGCGDTLSPQLVGFEPRSSISILCEGIVTYTYRYTACDNTSQDWSYTYIIMDTIAPILEDCSEIGATISSVNCLFEVPNLETAVLGKASDNCVVQEYVQVPPAGTILAQDDSIEVYVKDLCGNESEHQFIVLKVQDVATGMQSRTGYVRCNGDSFHVMPRGQFIPEGTQYTWTVDTSLHVTGQQSQSIPIDAPFSQALYNSDRISQTVLYRVTPITNGCPGEGFVIIVDVEPTPQLTLECPRDTSITFDHQHCERSLTEEEIGTPQWTHSLGWEDVVVSNDVPTDHIFVEGDNIITWTLLDACGNSASCEQHIHIDIPPCPDAVDFEGNIYQGVRIDCYCWTQRNLESTRYSDGEAIPGVYNYTSDVFPNTQDNVNTFGRLYDWESVIREGVDNGHGHVQGICPQGWYLPTAEQYTALQAHNTHALKSPDYWLDGGGDNSTGFTSLPAGYYDGSINRYLNLMGEAYYWSVEKVNGTWRPMSYTIRHQCENLLESDIRNGLGFSVRCIKEIDL